MLLNYNPQNCLPSAKDLPDSDDTPVDNELQDLIPSLLKAMLAIIWSERMDWFFGVDMGIYYDPNEPAIVPDGFLSVGVPRIIDRDLRLSYVLWEEQKVPILVLEVVSQKKRGEYTKKKEFYARMGVLYYIIYNPLRKKKPRLEVYRLENNQYCLQSGQPVWLSELGLGIGREKTIYQGINREWLYWYDERGKRYLNPEERIQQGREEGREEGRKQGKKEIIFNLIARKFGKVPLKVERAIEELNLAKLDELTLVLLNFSRLEDFWQWLDDRSQGN